MIIHLKTDFRNSRMCVPFYEHEGDSGMDVRWNGEENQQVVIGAHSSFLFRTGLWATIPSGYEFQVRTKSGLDSKYSIVVGNSPGTIDSSYTGEIVVNVRNHSPHAYTVKAGDKIAQIVLKEVPKIEWCLESPMAAQETTRGANGYGSTGL